jgi:hypothetical protein
MKCEGARLRTEPHTPQQILLSSFWDENTLSSAEAVICQSITAGEGLFRSCHRSGTELALVNGARGQR